MIRWIPFVQTRRTACSLVATVAWWLFAATSLVAADEATEKIARWKKAFDNHILPIIQSRCIECHQGDAPDGEFDMSKFTNGDAAHAANDVWERIGRRVRLNEMPPQGSPGLTDPQKSAFHRWVDSRPGNDLCNQLASDETQAWYKGHVMSRRLTQTEYHHAVQELVGLELLSDETPPADGGGGEGFDTVGDSLFTSTIHLERYLSIADRLIETALPDSDENASDEIKQVRSALLQFLPKDLDATSDLESAEAAQKNIVDFASRAWRRPIAEDEVARLLALFSQTLQRQQNGFVAALREPLKAVMVSPHFLFVVEPESETSGTQRLSPHQLATRLALFLWSSIPDAQLRELADSGALVDEVILRNEIRRMLRDPKARALGENFGLQWLGLRNFLEVKPDTEVFPEYDSMLASAMLNEAVEMITGIFREDRPLLDLLDADYVFVNGPLAQHYGLDLPEDAPWQRMTLNDRRRGGVVTMASVLTSSSYPRRTSPVLRGRWILEELLGSVVPPPPADVPALEEAASEEKQLTLRQRLELHREKAECASCHDRMDPLGFGLENFDAIGRFREMDLGQAIDNTGTLPSGEVFSGPSELKRILLGRSDEFQKHFVRKLLGFALGRELNKFDACVVDHCVKMLHENEGRSGILIEEIATSLPFQYRYSKPSE